MARDLVAHGVHPPQLRHYPSASSVEWIETDGVGGLASSSVLGANTRKQHALLSVPGGAGGRVVLVANVQETAIHRGQAHDLSTNAYFGAIHPAGFEALESFTSEPWPVWRYRFERFALEKRLFMVRGESTVVVTYRLLDAADPVVLVVRPLLAFRPGDALRLERGSFPSNWVVTEEFAEFRPFGSGPALYIAHPGARVETVSMWYRGFVYERDRENHLDCIEDLYHPGYFEATLEPDAPQSFVFSSPSPQSLHMAHEHASRERDRRRALVMPSDAQCDPLFAALLRAADAFVYERADGTVGIVPGLPWGECEAYRGLVAFAGLLLAPRRFDQARSYLRAMGGRWRRDPAPTRFSSEVENGQMHPADVPLWLYVAAWRFWKATDDGEFLHDELAPLLRDVAACFTGGGDVHRTDDGLLEVGHEPNADYEPIVPLGTNVLWYNAQRILSAFLEGCDPRQARTWRERADETRASLLRLFRCESRAGLADGVTLEPFRRYETLRCSQVLSVGLPFAVAPPEDVVPLIQSELATPYGLRTLAPTDPGYFGDGTDVRMLPKVWSGSVDPMWFGCYCDALKRAGAAPARDALFAPFETELHMRGYGHISGAFTGDPPHQAGGYVASAAALGEVMRIYARDVVGLNHVV